MLQPETLWNLFKQICSIPHGSGNTQNLQNYIKDLAIQNNCTAVVISGDNLLITKPAAQSHESKPTITLQAHIDMVCTKSATSNHNFETDPIAQIISPDGRYVTATNTTLGSDNGIGVAAALSILFSPEKTGKIEFLLTSEEETSMSGVQNLSPGVLTGKYLLNLDSEEIDIITIGSAGGFNQSVYPNALNLSSQKVVRIDIVGCMGGHSGCEIHLYRANAVKIMGRLLTLGNGLEISCFNGGNVDNAIPKSCFCEFKIDNFKEFSAEFVRQIECIKSEYKSTDPNMEISIFELNTEKMCASHDESVKFIDFLNIAPSFVLKASGAIIETSINLGIVKFDCTQKTNEIIFLGRSVSNSQMDEISMRLSALARLCGYKDSKMNGFFGGWTPVLSSRLLEVTLEQYQKVLNSAPKVEAVHAGLECGEILQKYPDIEAISIGPTIINAHSDKEAVEIKTVEQFYEILKGIINQLQNE